MRRNMTNSSQAMVDASNQPHKRSFNSLFKLICDKLLEAVVCSPREKSTPNSLAIESSNVEVLVHKNGVENAPENNQGGPDSEGFLSSIDQKLDQVRQDNEACSWKNLSIYRIPHYLKQEQDKDKAFIPQIVSLGPYYHDTMHLRQMEWHKCRCFDQILKRTSHKIDLYRDLVKEVEQEARGCYEGEISMLSKKFVEMMVLDGCFVIELLLGVIIGFEKLGYPRNDPVFSLLRSMHMIQGDMLKLENQIPLFILDQLLGLQFSISDHKGVVAKLALMFFHKLMPKFGPRPDHKGLEIVPDNGGLHFLEVFRLNILGLGLTKQTQGEMSWQQAQQRSIHSVTDLREAGIGFRERKEANFWDIKFEDGTLQIPQLQIHKGTRSLFLNLISFEQSHFRCGNKITSYILFMDDLIDSPEDVKFLRKRGIINHRLGSDAEVADLFNRLCLDVDFSIEDSYLSPLTKMVETYETRRSSSCGAYLEYKWNAWIAILNHNYFNNPWSIISVIAAFVLLVLTFTQTFYEVYGHYKSGS
ncbi:hypothetical protein ACJRO7_034426 [Eucalyptus globulus]|uniref:Uncharacterized protein n=1 Tax=Eucalyptus globulus TaxID=34317 RepID=A0ABD3J6B3_EUCGL